MKEKEEEEEKNKTVKDMFAMSHAILQKLPKTLTVHGILFVHCFFYRKIKMKKSSQFVCLPHWGMYCQVLL